MIADKLQNLQQQQAFIRGLIFALVTVIIWVGFSLFQTQQQTGISQDLQTLAVPMNPNIDETVIARLEAKRSFSPDELSGFPINRVIVVNGQDQIIRGTGDLQTLIDNATESARQNAENAGNITPSPTLEPSPSASASATSPAAGP